MNDRQFYVQQEARKYSRRLDGWASQVVAARTHVDAFRLASQPPPEGHMSAVVRPITQSERTRAQHKVERNLEKRLTEMSMEYLYQHQDALRRSTQGRYPRLFQRIVSKLMPE